jgi:hypothetical protein
MDFSFEIVRSNPTITSGLNSSAEWVDTLWEGKTTWTNKEKESVAVGMSEWMDGFRTKIAPPTKTEIDYEWYNYWGVVRNNRILSENAFDYAGRLMQAAGAIGDVNLKPEVKKADFLSHLVNLGGAYAALNPNYSENAEFFLDSLWRNSSSTIVMQEMQGFLGRMKSTSSPKEALGFLKRINLSLKNNQPSAFWNNSEITSAMSFGLDYYDSMKSGSAIKDLSGFLESIYYDHTKSGVITASRLATASFSETTSVDSSSSVLSTVSTTNNLIASNDRPSNDILLKIEKRYRDLAQGLRARNSGKSEAADNLEWFLNGSDEAGKVGPKKHTSYEWLKKFRSFNDTSVGIEKLANKFLTTIAWDNVKNFSGAGVEERTVNHLITGSVGSRSVLQLGEFDLLGASGAYFMQGEFSKVKIVREDRATALGRAQSVEVSANVQYYWYDDYNWNPGDSLWSNWVKGLEGNDYYDDEANLLVKYGKAKPYALFSGWDKKEIVRYAAKPRLRFLRAELPSQPSEANNRYISSLHSPYNHEDVDAAKVIRRY